MEARNSMERKKEQARRERENQARLFKEEQRRNDIVTNVGLFSEPVKTTTIDPIAKRVQDTLGKCRVENYRDAIGITHQPATPLPKDKKMSFPDVETRRQDHKIQYHKPEVEGTTRSQEDKNKPKNVHAKSHQSYLEKQRGTSSSHDKVSIPDKKSHQQVPSSSSSKSKANHNNLHHPPKKEHHQSPKPVKKEHITSTKNGPVNGRGSEENGEANHKSKVHAVNGYSALKINKNHNLPPLLIKEDHSVEDILKEMTQWHQPHTAIQTPHKDEMKFPFPSSPPTNKAPTTVRMSVSSTPELQTQRNPAVEGPRHSPLVNHSHLRYPERDKSEQSTVRVLDTAGSKYPKVSASGPGTNAPTKEQRMNSGDSSSSSEDESDSNESDSESQSSEEDDDKSDDNEEEEEEEEEKEEKAPVKHKSPINSSLSDKGHDTSKSSTCSTWALSNFIKNVESPISQLPSSNDNSKLSDKPNMTISGNDNDQVIEDLLDNMGSTGNLQWSPVLPTTKHTQQKSPFSIYSPHRSPPSKNSNRTSVNEKLKTSTPESKIQGRKMKLSEPDSSDEEESEEIDVESVTPGKEIIPEILRRNAGSDVVKTRLDFERSDSECVSRVTPNSSTVRKTSSKTKDKRDQTKPVSKRQGKENKENNDKKNCCSYECNDDIKNIFEQITVNPPLSPIPNVPENSNPKPSIPGLTYDSSGKPRIIVRFNLSLAKPIVKCNTSQNSLCSDLKDNKMCSDIKSKDFASDSDMDIDDDIVDSKVLIEECPKPESPRCNMTSVPFSSHYSPRTRNGDITSVKRRSDLDFPDNNKKRARSDTKRNSLGSSREKVSHSDNHEWDMKHPQRSECKERRNSSSSNSSQPRGTSKYTKETKNQSTEPDNTAQQINSDKEELEVPGNGSDNSGQYPSSVEMSSYSRGGEGDVAHVPSPQTRKSAKATDDWCTLSSDTYFRHARELKHQAESLSSSSDKFQKAMKYLESFIAFIQCGYAMERNGTDLSRIFNTYRDTNKLVSHISRLRGSHESNNNTCTKEKIVSVLSFRIQSLLNLKLYKMKKNDTERLKRAIEDYNKTTASKPPPAPPISHVPSPHQNSWSSRSNRTPSPMSPTPSPAGSTGSLESRGSSTDLTPSKLPNGNVHMSSATISYPQRIHSITQQYITFTGYLVQAHDFWEQADSVMQEVKGFFEDVEEHSEALTLLSSISDLICFLQKVVEKLKDT